MKDRTWVMALMWLALVGVSGCGTVVTGRTNGDPRSRVTPFMRDACGGVTDTVIAAEIVNFDAARQDGFTKNEALVAGNENCAFECVQAGGDRSSCVVLCNTCIAAIVQGVYP